MTARLTLKEVQVEALRCHSRTNWVCSPGINLITGENGCGKTTLLEAVYLMAHGRSFRQARDPELVRWGEKKFHIIGKWQRFGPVNIEVLGRRRKTEISVQGKLVQRRSDLLETLPVLVDAPHARRVVDGAPNERRHWLDGLIMVCRQSAAGHYKRYFRSVMQRNRLLRRGVMSSELDAWEHQIVGHGLEILKERSCMVNEINACLAEEELTHAGLSLSVQITSPDEEAAWLEMLHGQRVEDARMGSLRRGPHCDRLCIDYLGKEIRSAGSRGQQKLAAMSLKLAEHSIRMRHRNISPVMLMDDCLEALDPGRQHQLLARLEKSEAQVLLTAPSGTSLPSDIDIEVYELDAMRMKSDKIMPTHMGAGEVA